MAISFNHVHIKTADVAKTVQYYIDNYGATKKSEMPGRGWQLDLHGTQLNITTLISEQNHEQHLGIEHMAVTTDDYPGLLAKLRKNGVEVLEELKGSSGNRVAFVSATDGSQMEIIEKAWIHPMALKDQIPFGMSLPHRSPDTIGMDAVRTVATKAEALGFRDLWVTENTLDHVNSFDPLTVLTYAAGLTTRIGLGASVLVLPVHDPRMVAHQWATLDYVSNGRAIMGVGIGRPFHFEEFQVPQDARVARFREQIDLIRTLWTQEKVAHHGRFYHLEGTKLGVRPVQKPLPIWMGVGHPNAIRRSAELADGWMGAGGSTSEDFRKAVPLLREALEKAGRDPGNFPISKRIFIAVDEKPDAARAELHRWYTEVYRNPPGTDTSGIHGTPEHVRERLQEMIAQGANHLLLNPVSRHVEQLHALAEVVGLS